MSCHPDYTFKSSRSALRSNGRGVRTLFWGVELGQDAGIGRPRRTDEAGGIHHALNRGNARSAIFHKPEDYDAFERILAEGLTRYACRILAYRLMPNHWHFVL